MNFCEKVRLGILGCGWAARDLYAPFFKYLREGELIAVADIDKEKAKNLQRLTGCKKFYSDLDSLLQDKEIDAVMILTPTHLHFEEVARSAEAGKHIYCEKPMAVTIEQADKMISACRENNVKLQMGFMKRFNKNFQLVKQIIDEGRLGDIFETRAIWDNARAGASAKNGYRHSIIAGGGFLQEDGSHPIDILHWWMGEVTQVSGEIILVASGRVENEDVASVQLKHKSGAISSLHITMLTHRTGEESYEIFGTKGTLLMRWLYHSTHSFEPAIIRIYEKSKKVTDLTLRTSWNIEEEIKTNWQYLNEMRHFCKCIIEDKEPIVTGRDGRAVVEIVNAAYLSSREGRKIKLPLKKSPDFNKMFGEIRRSSHWKLNDEEVWLSRY